MTGDILNNSRLVIERSNEVLMTGLISGTGQLVQEGAGQTVLSGNNALRAGPTLVNFGSLYINGDQTAATGQTFVLPTATLGGTGIVGGDALVAGTLAPGDTTGAPGTLTINGSLTLGKAKLAYNFGQAGVVGGPLNDLTIVKGNLLVLDGTLNVAGAGGSFDPASTASSATTAR